MPELIPFRGTRYSSGTALAEVICPPYDVISDEERQKFLARNPLNAVRLEGAGASTGDYSGVALTLKQWLDDGILARDQDPSLYVYRQDFVAQDSRLSVTGVIGALRLEPFGGGVLPHERTMPGPKKDRLALLQATHTNFSPIYAIYRGGGALRDFMSTLLHRPPASRAQDDAGTLHRMWPIAAPAEIETLRSIVDRGPLVIADGHHRYETALAFNDEEPDLPGSEAIMCFCVDADVEELVVLPYHRGLKASIGPDEFGEGLELFFEATLVDDPVGALSASQAPHAMAFVTKAGAWLIEPEGEELDVVLLHEQVLPRLLSGAQADFEFTRDSNEVVERGRSGEWTAGILMRPLKPVQIVDVATSGGRMPQKASYFWPKAATGLVFRTLV